MIKENVSVPIIVELSRYPVEDDINELKRSGLKVASVSRLAPLVNGMATSQAINAISNLQVVVMVSYDEPTTIQSFPLATKIKCEEVIPISEAVNNIGAPALWDLGIDGSGVKIGVIDTGASLTHKMLSGIKDSYSAVPGESAEDHHSHGTWCASAAAGRPVEHNDVTLYGVAPGADLYIYKALGNEGNGQMSWVNDCIEHAVIEDQCDVLSMSLGSLVDMGGTDPTSKLVNEVTQKYNKLCVVAAGNSFGPMTVGAPGGAAGAITVGSVAMKVPGKGIVSTFSSKGPTTSLLVKPEIAAYGGNVMGPNVSELIYAAGKHGGYEPMAGSSMATPQVAGAMALLRQAEPELSRSTVEQLMAEMGFPHAKDIFTGYGTIRVDEMYNSLGRFRLPLDKLGIPLQMLQSAASLPLAMLPKAEQEQLNVVRLPVIRAS